MTRKKFKCHTIKATMDTIVACIASASAFDSIRYANRSSRFRHGNRINETIPNLIQHMGG